MSGKRSSWGLAARPPESRKRGRSGWPAERKPVSYVFICDDDEGNLGNSCCYDTLSLRNSGSKNARVSRSGGRGAGRDDDDGVGVGVGLGGGGNLCGEKTSIVVVDDNVGGYGDGRIGMEIADVRARFWSAWDGDDGNDDVLFLSGDGCVGLAGGVGNAGPLNEDHVDVGDCCRHGLLDSGVGNRSMDCDDSGVDPEYKQFLEMLRVDGTSYSVELSLLDGLSFVLAYEKGASDSGRRQPRTREACGSRKRNGKKGNAGPAGGWTRPGTSRGSREKNAEEADRMFMKCTRSKQVTAQGDRGPKGRERKFSAVSTGVKKGTRSGKRRALEPGTCKPDSQASKLLVAESAGKQNSQVQNEVIPDERYLIFLNSLNKEMNQSCDVSASGVKKGPQHVKKRVLEPGTCKPDVRASKLLVAESAGLRNFQVHNEVISDDTYQFVLSSLKKDGKIPWDLGIGERVIHEQNNQSSSHSDVMILDVNPSNSGTPLVVLDGDDKEVNSVYSRSECPQRKQLLELLKRPYCESELKAHMKEFRLRRPLEGYYELRSGRKSYNTEFVGRSYEDWHGDLADQIRSSKEELKSLNLLRGFFYWLQHAGHGSMDKPWKDPACLAVSPAGVKSRNLS